MNFLRILVVGGLLAALPAWAVYAPIPEQEQGKEWAITLRGGITHDSNIFGAQSGAISSMVYEFAPKIGFNSALSDQTFLSASYQVTLDYFDNRPGDKLLDSHDLMARLDHTFSAVSAIHVSDDYAIVRNPQSLLSGVTLNTDQSYKRNLFDAHGELGILPKLGATAKVQSIDYAYDNDTLANDLDHTENLYGIGLTHAFLPEVKIVGEYRHGDILYRDGGSTKNKHSEFVIGGVDYAVAKQLTATARLGYEWRKRDGEDNADAPYVELSLKYEYAQGSFFSAGYVYTFEETSNQTLYTDTKVNRLFFNVQHAVSARVFASASIDYEPSVLQGRLGLPNVDETTTRLGFALTYVPAKNWQLTASYDYDDINSDDPARGQNRQRVGLSAGFAF
ncbi:MAG: outer membrane beta-barrel protein [Opitutaceae bacterium]